jgi:hypothetical protein
MVKKPQRRMKSQDVRDPRVKSNGHRKKTADKWNQ